MNLFWMWITRFDIQFYVKSAVEYNLIEGVVKTTNRIRPSFSSTVQQAHYISWIKSLIQHLFIQDAIK